MSIADLACDLGDAVTLTMTFSVASVNTDPTTIAIELRSPSGTVTTYTYAGGAITRTAAGVYTKTLAASVLNAAGNWYYSWIGTGAAEGAEQGAIVVAARNSAA